MLASLATEALRASVRKPDSWPRSPPHLTLSGAAAPSESGDAHALVDGRALLAALLDLATAKVADRWWEILDFDIGHTGYLIHNVKNSPHSAVGCRTLRKRDRHRTSHGTPRLSARPQRLPAFPQTG